MVVVTYTPPEVPGPLTTEDVQALAAPGTFPVPAGRGRWRLTVHSRAFASSDWRSTLLGELTDARSRHLEQALNGRTSLSFTIDGASSQAPLIQELACDVMAWRWDDRAGVDRVMFYGIVDHSEDIITEQAAVVNFTCHDYLSVLDRRFVTLPAGLTYTQREQDSLIFALLTAAQNIVSSSQATSFDPGDNLGFQFGTVNPDGSSRASGSANILRDRTYEAGKAYGEAINDMSNDQNGFDYDVDPQMFPGNSRLRIWYPQQGVTRDDVTLIYGGTVSGITRTVASSDYANYLRVTGATPTGANNPLWAEAWNADANDVTRTPVGLWMRAENASDVSIQSTLNDKATGLLDVYGLLVPSYTVTMRPGAYSWGFPNMGDTVPLIVRAGRLDVNTTVRVVGIAYDIGDDGQEDIDLTVGRPLSTLYSLLRRMNTNIDQLARR